MIHTKRHEVLDLMRTSPPQKGEEELFKLVKGVFENTHLPHYVLSAELLMSLDAEAVEATGQAMAQAGVARLPHDEMMVEVRVGTTSQFIMFSSFKKKTGGLMVRYDGAHVECYPYIVELQVLPNGEVEHGGSGPVELSNRIAAIYAVAVVLSHTRGLAKEVVTEDTVRKLNKARAAKKRAPVLPYTVLHIGRVYRKDGTTYKHDSTGVMRRPHLRKGHARRQKYGPNWSQERWIFVPAAFVNWSEGDDLPTVKPTVVKW